MSANREKKPRGPGRRFKKGQSGNPLGRPRGPGLTTLLIESLKDKSANGKTYAEMLVMRVIQKAVVDGDGKLIEFIWDRVEGKLPTDITSAGQRIGLEQIIMGSMPKTAEE